MNGEEEKFATEINQDRAADKETKTEKPEAEKTKKDKLFDLLKTLSRNPLVQLLIPSLADVFTGGLIPGWLGIVLWTYISEKKAGRNPNIAEFLVVGVPAGTVDAIEYLNLTGVLYLLTLPISLSCLVALWSWRFYKHINKKPIPITKSKKA